MDLGIDGPTWAGSSETLVTVVVAIVLGTVLLGIVGRVLRHQGLKALARAERWEWVGKDPSFGRLVSSAFPELARSAKRSARRSAVRSGNRRTSSSRGIERAAGAALEITGGGTRARTTVRGRHVAVATGPTGDVTVGEVGVSARAHRRRSVGGNGGGSGTSSVRVAAAAARPGGSLPTLKLGRRTLLGRLTGGDDHGLPEELSKRFSVEEFSEAARVALIESGAWRELLTDEVKVQGVRVAKGHVLVMTRRRITKRRARALVGVVEKLVPVLAAADTAPAATPPGAAPPPAASPAPPASASRPDATVGE